MIAFLRLIFGGGAGCDAMGAVGAVRSCLGFLRIRRIFDSKTGDLEGLILSGLASVTIVGIRLRLANVYVVLPPFI